MKKTAKRPDFEYRCFPCLKQDDRPRSHTLSYNLTLHTVNTHKKFPVDLKNNTYYAADGSDLRDATEEQIKKYRLAASHKRRKPEVGALSEKSVSSTAVSKEAKEKIDPAVKRDNPRRRVESPRNSDRRDVPESRDDKKGVRTASRESRRDREEMRNNRGRGDSDKRCSEKIHGSRQSDQDDKAGGDNEELDEDERDRQEMSEIRHRMAERKAAEASVVSLTETKKGEKAASSTLVSPDKDSHKSAGEPKKVDGKPDKPARVSKKIPTQQKESTITDAAQRENAMKWASTAVSDTEIVTTNAIEQGSTLYKKRGVDKRPSGMVDTAESLAIQDFIAAQYPPVEEVVSSSVRLGRALVSGALGKKDDDPKIFEAAVNLAECRVMLQSTKRKSKIPVSAAPPNSTESEMDVDESGSIQLSTSATDVGVHIGLPGGDGVGGHRIERRRGRRFTNGCKRRRHAGMSWSSLDTRDSTGCIGVRTATGRYG